MKKQRAFTLAETLLTLLIVSVLATLLMSTIKGNVPKKQQIIFIKAFRNLETATADIIKDESRYDQNSHATQSIGFNQAPLSTSRLSINNVTLSAANAYCYFVAEQMNITKEGVNCSDSSKKNFQSTNGACYYDLYPFNGNYRDVTIDTACKGRTKDMFTVRIMADGKITIPSTGKSSKNQGRAAYWILNQGKFKEGSYIFQQGPPQQGGKQDPPPQGGPNSQR